MRPRMRRVGRSLGGPLVAVLVGVIGPLATGAPVRAASVAFGVPSATSRFGSGVDFSQPVDGATGLKRAEILVDYPSALGPAVTELANPDSATFSYHLDTSKGQLQPNTTLEARWRVTFADDSQQLGPPVTVTYADDRFRWQTKSGPLVRLHWYSGDAAFADRALSIAEQGVAKSAGYLGVPETKPVDFFVYADQASFYDALGPSTPENIGGQANTDTRTLFALITPSDLGAGWVQSVVPHELTHVVFEDAVRSGQDVPAHWLNEGIAVYLSDGYDVTWRGYVQAAARSGTMLPLTALTGSFPRTADLQNLAYGEAVSAVDYIVRTYGKAALVKLVKTYGAGASDDEAFEAALGVDLAAFDKAWLAANGMTNVPVYGPRTAPAGPIPPGWAGSAAGNGSSAGASPAGGASGAAAATAGNEASPAGSPARSRSPLAFDVAAVLGALAVVFFVVAVAVSRRSQRPGPTP